MILSKVFQRDTLNFLESKKRLFEAHAEAAGGGNLLHRTAIHIYSDSLGYLKQSTTTTDGLKKRLLKMRPTPQDLCPFVCYGVAAVAVEEDIISYLESGQPLIPNDLAKISSFFKEFKARLDEKAEEERKREVQLRREKEAREKEEMEMREQRERIAGIGLDPEKLQSFLASKEGGGGPGRPHSKE
jgi:hypothetical protein